MTLIAPATGTPVPPVALPPVTCASWCIDGTGHTDAPFPEDQVCRSATTDVELYLRRHPGAHTPTVEVDRGELGESVTFTLAEAEALGLALVRSTLQARGHH